MICPEPSELQELVRDLHRQATPWLPAGSGSRLAWGAAVQAGPGQSEPLVLSTARLNRILSFSPEDFTVTVQAGTPLVALQQELAHHRQWLALDWPWGSGPDGRASGSVGGLVARGLAGGARQRYLGVRDQLIGIGLMRADGTAARAGGQVVKNVAGYDLMRLLAGSWGSLALIRELTLRTLPIPPERRGLWLQGPAGELAAMARWLLESSLSPERIDWQHTAPSAGAGLDSPASPSGGLLLSLASISPQTLDEQIACIRERAPALTLECLDAAGLSRRLGAGLGDGSAAAQPAGPAWLLRLGVRAAELLRLLQAPELAATNWCFAAGSGLGMVWAEPSQLASHQVHQLRRRCGDQGGYLSVLRQPPGSEIPAWLDAPSRPLIEAIKRQFDPKQQLARGRLPGVQPQA
ncbi:MAG: FAD-binding oxidoreductase [Cyanobium sp.]